MLDPYFELVQEFDKTVYRPHKIYNFTILNIFILEFSLSTSLVTYNWFFHLDSLNLSGRNLFFCVRSSTERKMKGRPDSVQSS